MLRLVACLSISLTAAVPLIASPKADRLEAEARDAMYMIVMARTLASGCPAFEWIHEAAIAGYRPVQEKIGSELSKDEADDLRRKLERTGNNAAEARVSMDLARQYDLNTYRKTPLATEADAFCDALETELAARPEMAQLLRRK